MKERREAKRPGTDTRYTYAVGRIKALEARLISPGDMERLLDEETPLRSGESLRALGEFPDYSESIAAADVAQASRLQVLENVLEEQLRLAYNLLSQLSLGSNVIKILRLRYDFHNLKTLLKARLLGLEPEGLSRVGFLSPEQMNRVLDEKTFEGDVDPFVGETILLASGRVTEGVALDTIEAIVDGCYYETLARVLGVNLFLKEYARKTIDLINLRTFWRLQVMGWTEEKLAESLLPGGSIEEAFFTANFGTPMADMAPKVRDDSYRRLLKDALHAFQAKNDLSVLDKLMDDYLIEFLRKAKSYCFGLEPLVGYIAAKENEVTRLRTILYGKERSLPMETVRELLRSSYA